MAVKDIGDPRLQALFGASDPRGRGVRPTVRLPGRGLPSVIVMGAVLLAVLLFSVLNARRIGSAEPPASSRATDVQTVWQAPPPLYIPPVPVPVGIPGPAVAGPPAQVTVVPAPARIVQRTPAPIIYAPPPAPQMLPAAIPGAPRAPSGSPLVIDTGGASGSTGAVPPAGVSPVGPSTQVASRIRASTLASRSMTVPQGYLIPAVLETGFDSTQPGFARAVVSRDVRGFDGTNILVPRGSRLIGEYKSSVAQGQNRAVIIWTRLIRPDGMTIAMDSPAVDTVGRGGVPATVNTHFFARLGDALLQTTIGLGGALAQRSVTGPVVVVPGSTAATGQIGTGSRYVPTLTVPAGKSISVFVAHDLDFSAAGSAR